MGEILDPNCADSRSSIEVGTTDTGNDLLEKKDGGSKEIFS